METARNNLVSGNSKYKCPVMETNKLKGFSLLKEGLCVWHILRKRRSDKRWDLARRQEPDRGDSQATLRTLDFILIN